MVLLLLLYMYGTPIFAIHMFSTLLDFTVISKLFDLFLCQTIIIEGESYCSRGHSVDTEYCTEYRIQYSESSSGVVSDESSLTTESYH